MQHATTPRGSDSTRAVLDRVLAATPDVLAQLTAADEAAWEAADADLLDLCRMRIAMLLGTGDEQAAPHLDPELVADLAAWPTSPRFDATQRACLAFTEQWVIDVAGIDDATALAVVDHLGGEGFANFVHGLLVVEQRQRLRLVWERLGLADPEPATVTEEVR